MQLTVLRNDPYLRIARWYDSLFGSMNAGLSAAGMKLYPPREGMAVLDVGCGTGSNLDPYQRAGCEVFGIDTSAAMLSVARRKLGNRARLLLGDASAMPYSSNSFDLITAVLTLHEMPPEVRQGVMKEISRTLKSDGRALLIDFCPGPLRFPKGFLRKAVITLAEVAAGREHFRNYRDFMARNGLQHLSVASGLVVDDERVVGGGTMAMVLLLTTSCPT